MQSPNTTSDGQTTAPGAPAEELRRYIEDPAGLITGNAVRLLRNGAQAFPAMLEAIATARRRVSFEMYIFEPGRIGDRFAAALAAAARRGVEVRLLYDFVGSREAPASFFAAMRQSGVHVAVYHAYRFWRPRLWGFIRRNHRKLLVLDGELAFTGGLNVADQWLPPAEGGADWRDAMLELRGPAVARLEATFARTFDSRTRKRFRLGEAGISPPAAAGATPVVVIANTERGERFAIRRAALHAMRAASRRVWLSNPYFVPDRGILRALRQASGRGVDVRILIPQRSDFRFLDFASQATFGPLLRAGVGIFRHEAVLHTKCLLVDDAFVSLGSYNMDHRSLAYNLEAVVNVIDRDLAAATAAMLEDDVDQSVELSPLDYANRPLVQRLVEAIAYLMRQWL